MAVKTEAAGQRKIALLAALIVLALGALTVFVLGSRSNSGTIEPQVQQMKPGARGRVHRD